MYERERTIKDTILFHKNQELASKIVNEIKNSEKAYVIYLCQTHVTLIDIKEIKDKSRQGF